jgi:hypothetical protein
MEYRETPPHPGTSDIDPAQQDLPDYLDPQGPDYQVLDEYG